MAPVDTEEQKYQQEVQAIKQWWTDSRWRYTKRAYTAEQIAQKRGNITIDYPSNQLSKKLWQTVEQRFQVSLPHAELQLHDMLTMALEQGC